MTSSEQNQGGRAQDEILAGEYVLGVLPIEARRKVEQRIVTDRTFARIVKRWQTEIGALKIDDLDGLPTQVMLRRRERITTRRPSSPPIAGVWNSAPFWRYLALGASAIALAALLPDLAPAPAQAPATPYQRLAELAAPEGSISLVASYESALGKLRLVPVASGVPQDKAFQLWLVGADGRQQSLGLFGRDSNGEIDLPADLQARMDLGGSLSVSLEPVGGSPTGAPTGPIVATGPLAGF